MPPAGETVSFDGEWTGRWEDYVVDDVVPWATRHLPVSSAASMRSLAGLSAGGYGAVDIGLRHPGLACALESWSGYFRAPKDGSLRGASLAVRFDHDPGALAQKEAAQLARRGTRFFVSAGRGDGAARRGGLRFVALLRRLHLPHHLVLLPGSHDAHVWRGQLPAALRFAVRRALPGQRCGPASSALSASSSRLVRLSASPSGKRSSPTRTNARSRHGGS
jgi:enterochelin esterase-like enzyme